MTELLVAWGEGDRGALDALMPLVYDELRGQAERLLRREAPGHTLESADLVHKAYARLVDQARARWVNRVQFYGVAAELMRRILVDHARARAAAKRNRGAPAVSLSSADGGPAGGSDRLDVIALDDAITRLAALDARQARVAVLRYFADMSVEETAAALGVGTATVKRDWRAALAFLRRELAA